MTIVRIVLADPRTGRVPAGSAANGQQLIVLADDAGQRAVPLAFTDGLDRWELAGSFLAAGRPHWQDYSCAAADRSAVVVSAVPEPSGSAVLSQEIFAEDYRGRALH